jgi:hypothetical protein
MTSALAAARPAPAALALLTLLGQPVSAAPLVFQLLVLQNTWESYAHSTATPGVAIDSHGIVHFRGALASPDSPISGLAFRLPKAYRPNQYVYVPIDIGVAQAGRVLVQPDGFVFIQPASGNYKQAQIRTSLDGVTYSRR